MSPPLPPHKITFLPSPGPCVLTLPSTTQPPPPTASPSIPQPFHDAIAVRDAVFVIEQQCPSELDIEPVDAIGWHWILYPSGADSDSTLPIATARLVPGENLADVVARDKADVEIMDGRPMYENSKMWDGEEPYLVLGRVATRKEWRGKGFGSVLVEEAEAWAAGHREDVERGFGGEGVVWKGLLLAHAQVERERFYEGLGWKTDEGLGRWGECGIQHVGMWKRVEIKR